MSISSPHRLQTCNLNKHKRKPPSTQTCKEQQLKSSIDHDQTETLTLQNSIRSSARDKSAAELSLQNCEADIRTLRNQTNELSHEIDLKVVPPYLEWGGLLALAVALAGTFVAAVGVATLRSNVRLVFERVTEVTRNVRRAGFGSEVELPAEVEKVPREKPAKCEPKVRMIPVHTTVRKTAKQSGRRRTRKEEQPSTIAHSSAAEEERTENEE